MSLKNCHTDFTFIVNLRRRGKRGAQRCRFKVQRSEVALIELRSAWNRSNQKPSETLNLEH
jgi:hypothetical protein